MDDVNFKARCIVFMVLYEAVCLGISGVAQVYLALVAVPCRVSSLVLSPVPTKPAAATESGIGFTVLASHWKMKEGERGGWSRVYGAS